MATVVELLYAAIFLWYGSMRLRIQHSERIMLRGMCVIFAVVLLLVSKLSSELDLMPVRRRMLVVHSEMLWVDTGLDNDTLLNSNTTVERSRAARTRCRDVRNGSSPLSHAAFVQYFEEYSMNLPTDMRDDKWIDILCPIIRFDKYRQDVFQDVYSSARWRHGDDSVPLSGSGSTLDMSTGARAAIVDTIATLNISSMVDIPCGDLTWIRELFPYFASNGISYTGMDIVPTVIRQHQLDFPGKDFELIDYVDEIPSTSAELLFNREALQHVNFYDVLLALHHFSLTGAKYLLTTSYEMPEQFNDNMQLVDGATNTIIQLQKSPYCLRPVNAFEDGKSGGINRLKLFNLPLIRLSNRTDCL